MRKRENDRALAASSPPSSDGVGVAAEPVADRYSVLRQDHRRRIQMLGAAISLRDWNAVERAHAEIRDAFDRPDIYDPASLAPEPAGDLPRQGEPVAWAYEYDASDGWQRALWWANPNTIGAGRQRFRNIRPLYEHPPVAAGLVAGWKLVPVEPDQEMVRAAYRDQPGAINAGFAQAYRAMLAAAPTPPAGGGETQINRKEVMPYGSDDQGSVTSPGSECDASRGALPSPASPADEAAAAPSAPTAGAAVAGVAGDLDGLSARASSGAWSACGQDNGGCSCGYIFANDGVAYVMKALTIGDDVDPVSTVETAKANTAFVVALVNAYRTGQLVPAASRTEVRREEIGAPGSDPGAQGRDRYSINLAWSDEDAAFVGLIPELPGCTFHGETLDDAISEARLAIGAWIEAATTAGNPVPPPRQFDAEDLPEWKPAPGAQGEAMAATYYPSDLKGVDLLGWIVGYYGSKIPSGLADKLLELMYEWNDQLKAIAAPAAPRSADLPGRVEIAQAIADELGYFHDFDELLNAADAILKLLPPRGAGAETRADGGGAA